MFSKIIKYLAISSEIFSFKLFYNKKMRRPNQTKSSNLAPTPLLVISYFQLKCSGPKTARAFDCAHHATMRRGRTMGAKLAGGRSPAPTQLEFPSPHIEFRVCALRN
jgi:hypothetical protein